MEKTDMEQILESKDAEITRLQQKVQAMEAELSLVTSVNVNTDVKGDDECCLSNGDIMRYSRQLILPEIGVKGQLGVKNSSVLIVGAGGLGCPAAVYLAAAGIGVLGVVDYDDVEMSNLHRQILHTEDRVGVSKSLSVARSCHRLNSSVKYIPYHLQLNSSNALDIIKSYDIVLDCTDNVATRYLLNDACVLAGKPLVSGSALRFEGQLTVYNYDGGPCYRCLYPTPPPPATVTNCSDGGVLGVVPGIIGSMQALEAIKIASGIGSSYKQKLLCFDAIDGTLRSFKIRGRNADCPVCGSKPSITALIDYEQFCGAKASDKDKDIVVLEESDRISPQTYASMLRDCTPHTLLDVRTEVETHICSLPHPAVNIPLTKLRSNDSSSVQALLDKIHGSGHKNSSIVVVCRQGNDSQLAVNKLREKISSLTSSDSAVSCGSTSRLNGEEDVTSHEGKSRPTLSYKGTTISVVDIKKGLYGWQRHVDHDFPLY